MDVKSISYYCLKVLLIQSGAKDFHAVICCEHGGTNAVAVICSNVSINSSI